MARKKPDPDANVRRVVRLLMARDDVDAVTIARWIGVSRQAVYDRQGPPASKQTGKPKRRWSVVELTELARRFKVDPGIFFQPVDIAPTDPPPFRSSRGGSGRDSSLVPGMRSNMYYTGESGMVTGTLEEMLGVPA